VNRSIKLAKLLSFIYYNDGGFEDFYVGYTSDLSVLHNEIKVQINKNNFKAAQVNSPEEVLEAMEYLTGLGCREFPDLPHGEKKIVFVIPTKVLDR
jgi:hypothetical protein